jgi:hypothetical protein
MSSGIPSLSPFESPRERTARDYFRLRSEQRKLKAKLVAGPASAAELRLPTVQEIANADNLIETFMEMRGSQGQAPGPDGISYSKVGKIEASNILRDFSKAVLAGRYRPSPFRTVEIPKKDGGTRVLKLRNVLADRVIATALNNALTPYWNRVFLPQSHAWRPGSKKKWWQPHSSNDEPDRGVWTMLAEMELLIGELDYPVLMIDDVLKAFDSLIIDSVMADHARHIQDGQLLDLIETVLRGHEGKERRIGIDQGSAYSPTALNVHLHHVHDLVLVEQGHLFLRYGDNLVYVCRSVNEGRHVLHQVGQFLASVGLSLKGEDAGAGKGSLVELGEGDQAQLLGLQLSLKDRELKLDIGPGAWDQLHDGMVKAHEAENPTLTARQLAQSWLKAYGPAFEEERINVPQRLLETAAQLGFREIGSQDELKELWKHSWHRWRALRVKVRHSQGTSLPVAATAPPTPANRAVT